MSLIVLVRHGLKSTRMIMEAVQVSVLVLVYRIRKVENHIVAPQPIMIRVSNVNAHPTFSAFESFCKMNKDYSIEETYKYLTGNDIE